LESVIISYPCTLYDIILIFQLDSHDPLSQGRLSLYPGGADAPPPKLGGRFFGSLGGRTKNIDVLMIVMLKLANGFSDYEQFIW